MKPRDLNKAVTLRPRDIHALYGISTSTLHCYCTHPDPERRLPSIKVPGRQGRKGIRLIYQAEMIAWLERWRT